MLREKPRISAKPSSNKIPLSLEDGYEVAGCINQYLREYQRDGVQFLWRHFKQRTGAILADDMGLGKTIQVLAFFTAALRKVGNEEEDRVQKTKKRFLVVSPTSVLYNWADELDRWAWFQVASFHRKDKEEVLEAIKKHAVEIVLTTHETMRINIDVLCTIKWSAVVIDEVHRMKEPTTLLTEAANRLNTHCRIGLTGTPLQNNFKELWCLLDWANPGCMGSFKDYGNDFVTPIYQGRRSTSNKRELATSCQKLEELKLLLQNWMLRRTKALIKDQLPQKYEKVVFCPLSPLQVSIYQTVLSLPKVKLLLGMNIMCHCGVNLPAKKCCSKDFNWKKHLFPHMHLLLKTSNHAGLLLPHRDQTQDQKELCEKVCEVLFERHPILEKLYRKKSLEMMSDPQFSGKMNVLKQLLSAAYKKQDKVLVFSYSTKLLDILESYVVSNGLVYRRLDGDTSASKRNNIVKEFNSSSSIFLCLLSSKAGSLGMNFTSANVVIIFDPHWNPSHDQQAQDRAFRLGQQKDVYVYRLISVGTIEENIYIRNTYKQQLANMAVDGSSEKRHFNAVPNHPAFRGEVFGMENMFKFCEEGSSVFVESMSSRKHENDLIMADYQNQNTSSEIDKLDDIKKSEISDGLIVHSTTNVVGDNAEEQQVASKAQHQVFWRGVHSQLPANHDTSSSSEEELPTGIQARISERIGDVMFVVGSTPPAVRDEQFTGIARYHGFERKEFAKFILSDKQSASQLLRQYYCSIEPSVKKVSSFDRVYEHDKFVRNKAHLKRTCSSSNNNRTKKRKSFRFVADRNVIEDFSSDDELKPSPQKRKTVSPMKCVSPLKFTQDLCSNSKQLDDKVNCLKSDNSMIDYLLKPSSPLKQESNVHKTVKNELLKTKSSENSSKLTPGFSKGTKTPTKSLSHSLGSVAAFSFADRTFTQVNRKINDSEPTDDKTVKNSKINDLESASDRAVVLNTKTDAISQEEASTNETDYQGEKNKKIVNKNTKPTSKKEAFSLKSDTIIKSPFEQLLDETGPANIGYTPSKNVQRLTDDNNKSREGLSKNFDSPLDKLLFDKFEKKTKRATQLDSEVSFKNEDFSNEKIEQNCLTGEPLNTANKKEDETTTKKESIHYHKSDLDALLN